MKEKTAGKSAPVLPAKTPRWIPVHNVAELLSCTDQHVYDLIRDGQLQAVKIGERALRISEQSLDAFIVSRIINPADYFAPAEAQSRPIVLDAPINPRTRNK